MIFSIIIIVAGLILLILQLIKGQPPLVIRGTEINIGWLLLIIGGVFLLFDIKKAREKMKK